jgi:hypothetical protein
MKRETYWWIEPDAAMPEPKPLPRSVNTEREKRGSQWFERIRAVVANTPSFLEQQKRREHE